SQPLTGIVAGASAALRWLSNATPDIENARTALTGVLKAGHRASDVIGSIKAMFRKGCQDRTPVDLNELIGTTLSLMRGEIRRHEVRVESDLRTPLAAVHAERVQLQQVLVNLIMNAVDAMNAVTDRPRLLRVTTELGQAGEALVSIEDSGTGIDPKIM